MNEKQKILVCGDVEGRFKTLFTRVETINKKSGPFEMLLCVGNFFGINNIEFKEYRTGSKSIPISTYILGPNKEEHLNLYPKNESELCPNLYYLGKKGLYNTSAGFKIAYLSGVANKNKVEAHEFGKEDVSVLRDMCMRGQPNFRGVDILLTSQWPQNVYNLDKSHKLKTETLNGSNLVSWLATELKPRYHFSGLEGVYYERPPYRILSKQGDKSEVATRFISLARVGNSDKQKWIYAASLTPVERMRLTELCQQTTDETNCPYGYEILHDIGNKEENVQFFYNMNAPEEKRRNSFKGGSPKKKQRPEFDQNKCWFCLASPQVEKHLVISVGDQAYLALAKGGLVDEHLLILPIEHHQSVLTLPDTAIKEINHFKEVLTKYFAEQDKVPIFFERNFKTSHCQINVIPIPSAATKELADIFKDEAEGHSLTLEELSLHNRLDQVVPSGCPYFMVELPGTTLYTRCKSDFPLQFGREVLATGPILNLPDKSDWRECTLSRADEGCIVQRIRKSFEPFDFTL